MRGLLLAGALLGVTLGAAACGDDENVNDDTTPMIDANLGPDAAITPATFTSFVTSMIEDRTSETTDAEGYPTFSDLPDDDLANAGAYAGLFQ